MPRDQTTEAKGPGGAPSRRQARAGGREPPEENDPVAAVLEGQLRTIRRLLESYASGTTDSPDVEDEAVTAIHEAIDRIYDIRQQRLRDLPRAAGAREVGYQAIVAWQVKRLRVDSGTTQAQLAEAVNRLGFSWSRVTVAEIESGSRRLSLEELVALAAVFAMPLIDFLLPTPGHYLRMPDGRVVEPNDLIALVTGIGSDDPDLGHSLWSPAIAVAGVRPTEQDWRPAVRRSPVEYPHHRAQIVQAAIDARQRTLDWLEAKERALDAEEAAQP